MGRTTPYHRIPAHEADKQPTARRGTAPSPAERIGGESPRLFLHLSSACWCGQRRDPACGGPEHPFPISRAVDFRRVSWGCGFGARSCREQILTFPSTLGRCRGRDDPSPANVLLRRSHEEGQRDAAGSSQQGQLGTQGGKV